MSNHACQTSSRRRRRGLTLLELAVVLVILAAMAAAAAVATEKILAQRRFEITQAILDATRLAVLGRHEASATQQDMPVAGFVADVGRLPLAVGNDPSQQAAELWSNPAPLMPYGLQQSPLDPEVWLACGWRGPYLRLPTGATGCQDGWGRPLVSLTIAPDGTPVPAAGGEPIVGVASLGSDGMTGISTLGGTAEWSRDLSAGFYDIGPPAVAHWASDIQVRVWQRDANGDKVVPLGNGTLTVRLFCPNPSTGAIASLDGAPLSGPFASPPAVSFAQVPLGPKVLRAYFVDAASGQLKSPPLPIEVTRSGVVQWDLVLPTPLAAPPSPMP